MRLYHQNSITTVVMLLCLTCVMWDTGCTTGEPRTYPINGHTEVHRDHYAMGIKYKTDVEVVKTYEQEKEGIKISEAKAKSEIKIKRSERQEGFAFWLGAGLLGFAVASVIIGVVTKGYAFWGIMAATCGALGSLSFGFAHWIPYLKWSIPAVAIMAVFGVMHKLKDFSLKEYLKGRTQHG